MANETLNGISASAVGQNIITNDVSVYTEENTQDNAQDNVENEIKADVDNSVEIKDNESESETTVDTMQIDEETVPLAENAPIAVVSENGTTQTTVEINSNNAIEPTVQSTDTQIQAETSEPIINRKKEINDYTSGKKQGSTVTYHISTGEQNTSRNVKAATAALSEDFTYDVIKEKPKVNTVTFIKTDDFDGNLEPVIVSKVTVMLDKKGNVKEVVQGEKTSTKIIPDKSEYVSDNYTGFNVTEQKAREQSWKNSGIQYNSSKLDNPDYFYETFSSVIQRPETTQNVTENEFTSDSVEGYHSDEVIMQSQEENKNDRRRKEGSTTTEQLHQSPYRSGETRSGTATHVLQETSKNDRGTLRQDVGRGYEEEAVRTREQIESKSRKAEQQREVKIEKSLNNFGAEVRFFNSNDKDSPLGMHDIRNATIYLNSNSSGIVGAAYHELFHYLVATSKDFKDTLNVFLNIPFESDTTKIFNHVNAYFAKLHEGDDEAIVYFKQHPDKAIEEILANEFSNYMLDSGYIESDDSRLIGISKKYIDNLEIGDIQLFSAYAEINLWGQDQKGGKDGKYDR